MGILRMMRMPMTTMTICSAHAGALCVQLVCSAYLHKELPVCDASMLGAFVCPLTMCPRSSSQILKPTHTDQASPCICNSLVHTRGLRPLNQRTLVSLEHMNVSFLCTHFLCNAIHICQCPDWWNARGRLPGGHRGSGREVVEPRRCRQGDQDGREHPQTSSGHPDGPQPGKDLVQREGVDQEQRGGRQCLAHLHHLLLLLLWPLHS